MEDKMKENKILRQIRKQDVVYSQGREIKVERISWEALKVLNWYNMHMAVNEK